MTNERIVQLDEGEKLANEFGISIWDKEYFKLWNFVHWYDVIIIVCYFCLGLEFFETSAKDNINVKVVFER